MRTYYSVTMVLCIEQTSLELYIGSYKRHEDSVWILNTFTVSLQKEWILKYKLFIGLNSYNKTREVQFYIFIVNRV